MLSNKDSNPRVPFVGSIHIGIFFLRRKRPVEKMKAALIGFKDSSLKLQVSKPSFLQGNNVPRKRKDKLKVRKTGVRIVSWWETAARSAKLPPEICAPSQEARASSARLEKVTSVCSKISVRLGLSMESSSSGGSEEMWAVMGPSS